MIFLSCVILVFKIQRLIHNNTITIAQFDIVEFGIIYLSKTNKRMEEKKKSVVFSKFPVIF